MTLKVCSIPNCPTLIPKTVRDGRCDEHRQTTAQRGYDSRHQRERAQWAPLVAAGAVDCRRGSQCLEPELRIRPDETWELGHPDAACDAPKAPEHRRCNRATATHAARASEGA